GRLDVTTPLAPQLVHLLQLNVDGKERTETLEGPSTFEAQLTAVRATLQECKPFPLPADSYVRSMEAIDRVRAVLAERYGAPGALAWQLVSAAVPSVFYRGADLVICAVL